MWKKLISLGLAVGMMFSITACGSGLSAEKLYENASKKAAEMTSADMSMNMKMNMSSDGEEESMDITMKSDAKVQDMNQKSMKMSMPMTMELMGQSVEMSMYYEDGYYYMDSMGSKIKYAMDIQEMQKQLESSTGLSQLSADTFKKLEVSEKDGEQVLEFEADGSKMTEYLDAVMGSMNSILGDQEMDMNIESATGSFHINKDGYFTAQTMHMVYNMTVQEQTVKMDMNIDVTYNNPGQDVTVETPTDLDTYQEVDMNALTEGTVTE